MKAQTCLWKSESNDNEVRWEYWRLPQNHTLKLFNSHAKKILFIYMFCMIFEQGMNTNPSTCKKTSFFQRWSCRLGVQAQTFYCYSGRSAEFSNWKLVRCHFKCRRAELESCLSRGMLELKCRQRRALECHMPRGITRWLGGTSQVFFFSEKMPESFITFMIHPLKFKLYEFKLQLFCVAKTFLLQTSAQMTPELKKATCVL